MADVRGYIVVRMKDGKAQVEIRRNDGELLVSIAPGSTWHTNGDRLELVMVCNYTDHPGHVHIGQVLEGLAGKPMTWPAKGGSA